MKASQDFLSTRPYLREISLAREKVPSFDEYPFSLPVVRNLNALTFHPDVTFLVGENGTGKSTLLEAIAQLLRYNPEGGSKHARFATRETHSSLDSCLKIVKGIKLPRDGYFLRAESFYNVASYIDDLGYQEAYGGRSLHEQSHGEAFLSLLSERFHGNGLYLLDEPEAALSPTRQMAALTILHRLVKQDSQFIIATHSPILLAYPHAKIYALSETDIREVTYADTDHYKITRDFLNQYRSMLAVLLDEPGDPG